MDGEGDIWANRLGINELIVQDHHDPQLVCASAEVIKNKGKLLKDVPVKVCEFKCTIVRNIYSAHLSKHF